MTNVFISWSGDVSKELAEELRSWIPSVLQFAKPYFTPNDIEKGSKWGTEIAQKLADTNVGIICLTKDNFTKPWILFEAGALSKDLDRSKVCSVLFNMDNADLTGPLTTFQTTLFDKADFKKLMSTINESALDRALSRETFENVFAMWWPRLEEKVKLILAKERKTPQTESRSERDILEELLELTRLTARRSSKSNDSGEIPIALVDHYLGTLEESLSHYEESDNKYLYSVLTEQFDIARYLISTRPEFERKLLGKCEQLKERFDNIIPF